MSRFRATLLFAALMAATPGLAKDPIFIAPDPAVGEMLLPNPPAEGSPQQQAELTFLHDLEKTRTEAESTQAKWDDVNEDIFLFHTELGDGFNAEKLPLTAAFGKRLANDASVAAFGPKTIFHRVHPYVVDKTLNAICKTKAKDDSYPSGHTTLGWVTGLVLVQMVPEKKDEILARAEAYGRSRLICGVHYPSDVEASKRLAYATHALMTQNPQYKIELAAARAELRAALGLPEIK